MPVFFQQIQRIAKMSNKWFKFNEIKVNAKNNNKNLVECFIYDEIGGFGVTAADFVSELKRIDKITNQQAEFLVNINSPGGDVFEGLAIYNALQELGERCSVIVNGLAASAASLIACGAKECIICENALLMIHNPFTMAVGNATELRKIADTLDKCNNSIINIYKNKCKDLSTEQITQMMDQETWLDANEAIALGFADVIRSFDDQHKNEQQQPTINNRVFKRMGYKNQNLPKNLIITSENLESEPKMEILENPIENNTENFAENNVENNITENAKNDVEHTICNTEKTFNLVLKMLAVCKQANINDYENVCKASLANFRDIDLNDNSAENIIDAECKRIIAIKNICDLAPISKENNKDQLLMEFVKNNSTMKEVRAKLFDLMIATQSENQVDNSVPIVENQSSHNIPTPDEVYNKRRGNKC